ncbi:MAG: alkaline phosphatase D family protein [Pseudomonadota bacterium]|nr:alkaline phosphatase D family protein [Pseudomonadota bacterium]
MTGVSLLPLAPSVFAADSRFALGIASGQPHARGMVLWTRLTGADLADRIEVRWEVADDEGFRRIVASGVEIAEADWAHSVHAEPNALAPGRWYWYRFRALGEESPTGRTRTAPAADAATTLRFAIANCQRFDVGRYAAWQHIATSELDLVMFLGDYIYESASRRSAIRRHEGGVVRTLAEYRARYATYKSDRQLQAAHAALPWLLVWDDHEVENDYAGMQGTLLEQDFAARRAAAYRAYWEHMPFAKAQRPVGPDMRIVGRLDWGRLARIHLLDDRQYRDVQACPRPGRGGSNTVPLADCPGLLDPARSLLGSEQERWLADGWDLQRPWNLLAQQTLMARFSWTDTARGGATYWTDGWDGYPHARRRLLDAVAAKQVPGVVVLGGDVHSHYVADLKADFDDPASPTLASEFCATSITSLSLAQERLDAARPFNPHVHYAHADERGYMSFVLDSAQLEAKVQVVEQPRDASSGVVTSATFIVEAGRPGPRPA